MRTAPIVMAGLLVLSLGPVGCDDDDDGAGTAAVTNGTPVVSTNGVDPTPAPIASPVNLLAETDTWAANETVVSGAVAPANGTITSLVVSRANSDMVVTLEIGGTTVAGPVQGASVSLSTTIVAGQNLQTVVYNPSGVPVTCDVTVTFVPSP